MARAWEVESGIPRARGRLDVAWREVAARWLDRLGDWEQRAGQRRQLAELDDRALADIGRSRAEAMAEAAKPFWRK